MAPTATRQPAPQRSAAPLASTHASRRATQSTAAAPPVGSAAQAVASSPFVVAQRAALDGVYGFPVQREADSPSQPSGTSKPAASPAPKASGQPTGNHTHVMPPPEQFSAGEENHKLWVSMSAGVPVVMVASDPMPLPQRLRGWKKEADKSKTMDPKLKSNIDTWLDKCWTKYNALTAAAEIEDESERESAISVISNALTEFLKPLFWAFKLGMPDIGALAFYRGIHFSNDWQAQRGRTVDAEAGRDFESVKAEGSYSSASWEVAKRLAGDGPVTKVHLIDATKLVMEVMQKWEQTTNLNRPDEQKSNDAIGRGITNMRSIGNNLKADELQSLLDQKGTKYTQSGNSFASLFQAALSRYIDKQSLFETEMSAGGGYGKTPFTKIPFLSTSKSPAEAVKYAKGKLAAEDKKSTVGTVGRVLVYAASRTDFLEARGIDVWAELGAGRLMFTTYRMAENEITFPGMIPEHFLRTMTPVGGATTVEADAALAGKAGAKAAQPFGGLKPLKRNTPHD